MHLGYETWLNDRLMIQLAILLLPLKERIIAFKLDENPVKPWRSPVVLENAFTLIKGYLLHLAQFQAFMLAILS